MAVALFGDQQWGVGLDRVATTMMRLRRTIGRGIFWGICPIFGDPRDNYCRIHDPVDLGTFNFSSSKQFTAPSQTNGLSRRPVGLTGGRRANIVSVAVANSRRPPSTRASSLFGPDSCCSRIQQASLIGAQGPKSLVALSARYM